MGGGSDGEPRTTLLLSLWLRGCAQGRGASSFLKIAPLAGWVQVGTFLPNCAIPWLLARLPEALKAGGKKGLLVGLCVGTHYLLHSCSGIGSHPSGWVVLLHLR